MAQWVSKEQGWSAILNTRFNTSSAGCSLLPDFSPYSTITIVPVSRAASPAWMSRGHRQCCPRLPSQGGVSRHCHVPVMLPFPAQLGLCARAGP